MKTFEVLFHFQDRKKGPEGSTVKLDASTLPGAMAKATREFVKGGLSCTAEDSPHLPDTTIWVFRHVRQDGRFHLPKQAPGKSDYRRYTGLVLPTSGNGVSQDVALIWRAGCVDKTKKPTARC